MHSLPLIFTALMVISGCATTKWDKAGPRTIAVLPLDAVGQVAQKSEARVRRSIQKKVAERTAAKVVDPSEVDRSLEGTEACEGQKRREEPCAVSVGSTLGASHVVSGALGGLGKTFLIQLKLVDVQRAAVTRSLEEAHFGGSATLDAAIDKAVGRLFLVQPRAKPWYKRWWIWAMVGAAAATAVVLSITLHESDPYEDVPLP